jgi:O-antigen/teichoic acid export membrane protein
MLAKGNKSIKQNFIMNVMLLLSSVLFPLITYPYVSRVLLPDGIGRISFATSLVSYFSLISQLGIPIYGIRATAKVRDNKQELSKTVQELFIINLVMTLVSYILLIIVIHSVSKFQDDLKLYFIISFTILFNTIGMEWLYKGLEEYKYITQRSIVFKIVALVAMFLFVHNQEDYLIYGGITILAASASGILNFINVRKLINLRPVKNYNFRQHFKPIGVFFAMSCATIIYTNMDKLMLGFMTTNSDVGYYEMSIKIKVLLTSIVTSLGAVLLPRLSYYIERGEVEEFNKIIKKSLNFVFLIATPLAVYFSWFARPTILLLAGKAFSNSVLPMKILMPSLLFIGLSNLLGMQMLVPMGKENIVLKSEIIGAFVDILLNAILIPRYAAAGAAIGTTIAEFTVLFVQYLAIKKDIMNAIKSLHIFKFIISLILSSLASVWVNNLELNNFVTLLISAILFFGCYFAFLLITKESLIIEIYLNLKTKIINIK